MKLYDRFLKRISESPIPFGVKAIEDLAKDLSEIAEKWFVGAVMNIAIKAEEFRQEVSELKLKLNKDNEK